MKRIAIALLCTGLASAAMAAGGKGRAKGKSGAPLSAAPSAPATSGRGGGTAVLGAAVVAGRAWYVDPRYAPPMDPERVVSEQDCTKALDLTRGNLKCK